MFTTTTNKKRKNEDKSERTVKPRTDDDSKSSSSSSSSFSWTETEVIFVPPSFPPSSSSSSSSSSASTKTCSLFGCTQVAQCVRCESCKLHHDTTSICAQDKLSASSSSASSSSSSSSSASSSSEIKENPLVALVPKADKIITDDLYDALGWTLAVPLIWEYLMYWARPGVSLKVSQYRHAISVQLALYDMHAKGYEPMECVYWLFRFMMVTPDRRANDVLTVLLLSDKELITNTLHINIDPSTGYDVSRCGGPSDVNYDNLIDKRDDTQQTYDAAVQAGMLKGLKESGCRGICTDAIEYALYCLYENRHLTPNRWHTEFVFGIGVFTPMTKEEAFEYTKTSRFKYSRLSGGLGAYEKLLHRLFYGGDLPSFKFLVEESGSYWVYALNHVVVCKFNCRFNYGMEWDYGRCNKLNKQQTRLVRYLLAHVDNAPGLLHVNKGWSMKDLQRDTDRSNIDGTPEENEQDAFDDNEIEPWNIGDDIARANGHFEPVCDDDADATDGVDASDD